MTQLRTVSNRDSSGHRGIDIMTIQVNTDEAVSDGMAVCDERPLVALHIAGNLAYPMALDLSFGVLGPATRGLVAGTLCTAFAFITAFATPVVGFATILRHAAPMLAMGPQSRGSDRSFRLRQPTHRQSPCRACRRGCRCTGPECSAALVSCALRRASPRRPHGVADWIRHRACSTSYA